MKKNTILLLTSVAFLIASCGPSAEEKAAEQQRIQDSTAEVQRFAEEAMIMEQQRMQDSVNAVLEQMRLDSTAMAAEMNQLKKGSSKPKSKPTTPPSKGTGVTKGGTEINKDGTTEPQKTGVTKGGKQVTPDPKSN